MIRYRIDALTLTASDEPSENVQIWNVAEYLSSLFYNILILVIIVIVSTLIG